MSFALKKLPSSPHKRTIYLSSRRSARLSSLKSYPLSLLKEFKRALEVNRF